MASSFFGQRGRPSLGSIPVPPKKKKMNTQNDSPFDKCIYYEMNRTKDFFFLILVIMILLYLTRMVVNYINNCDVWVCFNTN